MKALRILGYIALLVFALFIGRQVYLYLGRGTLTISATPTNATIVINKKPYTNNTAKNITLAPGEHAATISAPGYKTLEQVIEIGWQETMNKQYILKTKPLKDIYAETKDATDLTGYDVVQEKFFLNQTWVVGYAVPADEDSEGDISVIIMQRKDGVWRTVLHSDSLPDDAAQQLPAPVYEYVKKFGEDHE